MLPALSYNREKTAPEFQLKKRISELLAAVARLESDGGEARNIGDEARAEKCFTRARKLALEAADNTSFTDPRRLDILRMGIRLTLRSGRAPQARQLIREAFTANVSLQDSEEWRQLGSINEWTDEWLMASARQNPPDLAALDALVERHWKALFSRCVMLTLNHQDAADLAQSTWSRVLRTSQRLNPGRNFPAYLARIATNLWRDSLRAAGRAGPLAKNRLVSLNDSVFGNQESSIALMDTLPDLTAMQEHDRRQLVMDIDQALAKLSPFLREVLLARFIAGESCAEIGRIHGRTEQTVSGWIRKGIRHLKHHLEYLEDIPVREAGSMASARLPTIQELSL